MCGRYATTRAPGDLAVVFDASDETGDESLTDRYAPVNYNVAPTDPVAIVRQRPGVAGPVDGRADGPADGRLRERASRRADSHAAGRVVSVARWGLVPPWAREPTTGARMINARAETVRTSRAYRGPFARRRCLVPADGWYEWCRRTDRGGKQAYYLTPRDGGILAFAALWEVWSGGSDGDRAGDVSQVTTTTVLTAPAAGELTSVHHRMPVVLPPDMWRTWLGAAPGGAASLLESASRTAPDLEIRPVGPAVGDVRNNHPGLIHPVTGARPGVEDTQPVDLTLF